MLNRAILMGRLTADPDLRQTPSGVSVTVFRIAVDRNYAKDRERQTDFIDIVAWRGTAEFVTKYFRKGSMIIVEGSIQTRNYEDKNGNKRTAVEVVANNVQLVGSKKQEDAPHIAPGVSDDDAPPFGGKLDCTIEPDDAPPDSSDLPF